MNKKKHQEEKSEENGGMLIPKPNRRSRRRAERIRKKQGVRLVHDGSKAEMKDGARVYRDESYKDKTKRVYRQGMDFVKKRLSQKSESHELPERIRTERKPLLSDCLVINRDGRQREFLPDVPSRHKILVHRSVARVMVSEVCMLVRITRHEDRQGGYIDGSWAIMPVDYRMGGITTIQHVRRRPWWFLHRYWYEISFDGRVQPASLFYDYNINVEKRRQRLWITREYVPVNKTDEFNDYFRLWKTKQEKV